MAIVPAGKFKLMVAQTVGSPMVQGYEETNSDPTGSAPEIPQEVNTEGANNVVDPEEEEMNPPELQSKTDSMGNSVGEPNVQKGKETLSDYIGKKLESFGYPPRRLEEFKSKFVSENVTPEGIRDMKVIIPDRKYPDAQGNIETIESEDLAGIVREMQGKFGLNFAGADRTDGKWTISLTSAKQPANDEQGMQRDGLEEVYGTPGGGKAKAKKPAAPTVRAFTQSEMIKGAKSDLVTELVKILENK